MAEDDITVNANDVRLVLAALQSIPPSQKWPLLVRACERLQKAAWSPSEEQVGALINAAVAGTDAWMPNAGAIATLIRLKESGWILVKEHKTEAE